MGQGINEGSGRQDVRYEESNRLKRKEWKGQDKYKRIVELREGRGIEKEWGVREISTKA